MCSYLSKQEDECSQAMKQAVKEAVENNLGNYQQMKSVAHAYSLKEHVLCKNQYIILCLNYGSEQYFQE